MAEPGYCTWCGARWGKSHTSDTCPNKYCKWCGGKHSWDDCPERAEIIKEIEKKPNYGTSAGVTLQKLFKIGGK